MHNNTNNSTESTTFEEFIRRSRASIIKTERIAIHPNHDDYLIFDRPASYDDEARIHYSYEHVHTVKIKERNLSWMNETLSKFDYYKSLALNSTKQLEQYENNERKLTVFLDNHPDYKEQYTEMMTMFKLAGLHN